MSNNFLTLGAIGVGGALGAIGRYGFGKFVIHYTGGGGFPYSTLTVNILGCFCIGLFAQLLLSSETVAGELGLHPPLRMFLSAFLIQGFLGGFTTFSSFGLEFVELLRRGEAALSLLYVASSVVGGGLSTVLGWKFMAWLAGLLFSANPPLS
ncbi:MAG: CrcB family protein [Bdellovibrionales bacterium]|nr:CrcB family protein [Bdellovibrionales bacterium]